MDLGEGGGLSTAFRQHSNWYFPPPPRFHIWARVPTSVGFYLVEVSLSVRTHCLSSIWRLLCNFSLCVLVWWPVVRGTVGGTVVVAALWNEAGYQRPIGPKRTVPSFLPDAHLSASFFFGGRPESPRFL